ncbi:MAG: hypothetical protein R3F62_05415 [Planctomycetota bacterium]
MLLAGPHSWRALPTSAWLVGGAGTLLAALALALSVWSKDLVKDTLRYGCTEFGARQQVLARQLLQDLQLEARHGALPAEVRALWTYRDGALVQRAPEDAPEPLPAFAEALDPRRTRELTASRRAVSWTPAPGGPGPSGWLTEWDLDALAQTLRAQLAQESQGRYVGVLSTEPPAPGAPHAQAELVLPEPLSRWIVSVNLRDPDAERTALRLQTVALTVGALWLFGVFGFGFWRGVARERRERAERAQREQLLVRTTHELQTPLALLRAACESLENGSLQGAGRERALSIVVREEARLTAAIRRLLRHLSLHTAPLSPAPVGAVVEEVAAEEREALAAHGVELALDVDPATHDLEAPRAFVADLVRELCANARKHAQGARQVELQVQALGSQVRLRYADDGPGFPPGERAAQGLGLLLLRDGVAALGGRLTHRASPSGGAELEVRLPCQRPSTPS